jgi:hypothetical protein
MSQKSIIKFHDSHQTLSRIGNGLRFALLAGVSALLITLLGAVPMTARAQTGWSQPVLVFESQGTVWSPSIVVDVYGQVHGFWAFTPDPSLEVSGREIYYARLDHPDWTPTDIYVIDGNIVSMLGAVNDNEIGLMWNGGMYAWSPNPAELSARGWTEPQEINKAYNDGGIAVAPDKAIWIVYGDSETNAIFVRRLDPQTHIWGAPLFVANTAGINAAPNAARMAFTSNDVVHVVWTEFQLPNGWPPAGVYYSRSTDGGQNWTAPATLGDGKYNQPFVATGEGQTVYIGWNGIVGIGGKYFTQSTDGGVSWSGMTAVMAPGTGGGSSGAPNIVVDNDGTPHMLFSNEKCVYYASLEPTGWTDPDCISRDIPSTHTEFPAMTIGLGNKLHVLFWTNNRELWYMTRQLPIQGVEQLPSPTPPLPTPIPPTEPPVIIPTATHLPDFGAPMEPGLVQQGSIVAVIGGLVPVVLLIGVVMLWRMVRK